MPAGRHHNTNHQHRRLAGVLCAVVLSVATLLATVPATAADAGSRDEAISIALRGEAGDAKVLGVRTLTDNNGNTVFAVKLLVDGRVRVKRIRQR